MASLAPDLDTLPVHEWPHFDGLVLAAVREGGGSALTVARRLGDELNVADPPRKYVTEALWRLKRAGKVQQAQRGYGWWRVVLVG